MIQNGVASKDPGWGKSWTYAVCLIENIDVLNCKLQCPLSRPKFRISSTAESCDGSWPFRFTSFYNSQLL